MIEGGLGHIVEKGEVGRLGKVMSELDGPEGFAL